MATLSSGILRGAEAASSGYSRWIVNACTTSRIKSTLLAICTSVSTVSFIEIDGEDCPDPDVSGCGRYSRPA